MALFFTWKNAGGIASKPNLLSCRIMAIVGSSRMRPIVVETSDAVFAMRKDWQKINCIGKIYWEDIEVMNE